MKHFNAQQPDFQKSFKAFLSERNQSGEQDGLRETVRAILRDVQSGGVLAVQKYTKQFDHFDWDGAPLSTDYIKQQAEQCDPKVYEALALAAKRIKTFHSKQLPQGFEQQEPGIVSGLRWNSMQHVGIYVPGGRASYPSSVLMNAIPAQVAGVSRISMAMPIPHGEANPAIFAAAQLAGVTEIYPVGGAQAIAFLTYCANVDKIVGPGNIYVSEAKRQVYGTVGIDSIAGPSEILVVADKDANPNWLAWDLLSQAEHDPEAQSILISDNSSTIDATKKEIENILKTLPKAKIARQAIEDNSATILDENLALTPEIIDIMAPEHLQLCVDKPQAIFDKARYIGSCFLGHYTPEAIGDYTGGANHVLPTMTTARFSSGLSVYDFLTRTTYLELNQQGFMQLADATATLADAEGLAAHAGSVRCRL